MPDDIDRLHNRLDKVFDYLENHQQAISKIDSAAQAHYEASEIRIKGYDSFIESFKAKDIVIDQALKKINTFITTHEAQQSQNEKLRGFISWFFGVLTAISGLLAYIWVKK